MTAQQLDGRMVVGARAYWTGIAPFHRAGLAVALDRAAQRLLLVSHYVAQTGGGIGADGETVGHDEWESLVAAEEAMWLPKPVETRGRAWLWLFRPSFVPGLREALGDLEQSGGLLCPPWWGDEGQAACLVDEARASLLRETWADSATLRFEQAHRAGDDERALEAALSAFHLESRMSPRRTAMLIAAYRQLGRTQRAEGLLAVARNVGGVAMYRQTEAELRSLRAEGESEGPGRRHASRTMMQMRRDRKAMLEVAA